MSPIYKKIELLLLKDRNDPLMTKAISFETASFILSGDFIIITSDDKDNNKSDVFNLHDVKAYKTYKQ